MDDTQLADLARRVQSIEASRYTPPVASTQNAPSYQEPYWLCTYCNGLTLTTGAALDWDPLFDNAAATDWMQYRLAAGYGSFDKGNLGYAMQRRWSIVWDSPVQADVKCLLSGASVYTADTDANIQVKHNGVMTEYAAGSGSSGLVSQPITLKVASGRNRLVISADIDPDTVQFCGLLFNDTSHWVPE